MILGYVNNISFLICNAGNIFKGFQVFMAVVQMMVFFLVVVVVGFGGLCHVLGKSLIAPFHSSDWPKCPQIL
jgi:hypothetical protein